jgi:hypothetical protein
MKHSVPHDLGLERAKKVTESAWESYSQRFSSYKPTMTWTSDTQAKISFSVKGASLEGGIEVGESNIDLELEVPFLLKPFRGKAISVIEEEIKEWIGKAKAGEI